MCVAAGNQCMLYIYGRHGALTFDGAIGAVDPASRAAYIGWAGHCSRPVAWCEQRRCLEAIPNPRTQRVRSWTTWASWRRTPVSVMRCEAGTPAHAGTPSSGHSSCGPRLRSADGSSTDLVRIIDARLYHPRDGVEAREWRFTACLVLNVGSHTPQRRHQ